MKKIITLLAAVSLLASCKAIKQGKENKENERKLQGTWCLTDVEYSKNYKISPFSIADAKCFEGSTWSFSSNNHKGSMKLNPKNNCSELTNNFIWNIQENHNFTIKLVGDKKAKDVKQGYSLHIENISENSFHLIDTSTETSIVYKFEKK